MARNCRLVWFTWRRVARSQNGRTRYRQIVLGGYAEQVRQHRGGGLGRARYQFLVVVVVGQRFQHVEVFVGRLGEAVEVQQVGHGAGVEVGEYTCGKKCKKFRYDASCAMDTRPTGPGGSVPSPRCSPGRCEPVGGGWRGKGTLSSMFYRFVLWLQPHEGDTGKASTVPNARSCAPTATVTAKGTCACSGAGNTAVSARGRR